MTRQQQLGIFDAIEAPSALWTPDEIFGWLDTALLEQLAEDRRIERKPAQFAGDQIGEYVSMWANTEPSGGILVIGILNDGRPEGLTRVGQEQVNKIEKAPGAFAPDAQCTSRRVEVINLKGERDFVLAFRVEYHPRKVVKTSRGDAFIRRGDEKHKLRPEEVRELAAEKGELSFETEPSALRYPEDFDVEAVKAFVASVKEARDWTAEHSDIDVLALMHLGSIDSSTFRPNMACALLFAKDPRTVAPGCRVRFLRFDGEHEGSGEKWNAIKDIPIDGQLPRIIEEADRVIQEQTRTFSRLGPNGKFYTQPEYPRLAWYEAVVNACVHRSYGNGLRNMTVFVKMFDDRLVIESPGPFPPFVTPENIYEVSHPRNPHLMEAMRHMDFVKCAHEGTRRIRDTMSEMSLPMPKFEESEIGHYAVRVTLHNDVHQRKVWVDTDVTELVGTMVAASLSDRERRFLNFMAEHGALSVSDAARVGGCTWGTAK